MNKSGAVGLLLAGLVLCTAVSSAQESAPTPPTDLKLVGDHWTAWDPPEAGPGAYLIERGDTLWDLAGKWLGDPFLWPQVWDENRYILDSHWIYPGDPLVIPGRPEVVPDGELPADEGTMDPGDGGDTGEGETTPEPEPTAAMPVPAPLVPVADATDIYCSGFIAPDHQFSELWVAGGESEKIHQGTGDVVYLNQGKNQGIQAGDEFAIQRYEREVKHPDTGGDMGGFVRRLGRLRVLLTQDNTATAVVEMSCSDVRNSDELVPWEEIPIPRRSEMPEFDRYNVAESGGADGFIVTSPEDLMNMAEGQIIYTDLGVGSGVNPGDVLTIYRGAGELPRRLLGQAVVLTVEPLTSTAKITLTVAETAPGDRVEVYR